ncbi:hypothetical protein [endosymbiont DhMRE of Dentiscutata heterogama]|uniref:hypothetical protein n=1 Tax=endosymbiont DhMRE of Dentiscutata heterogama TaxID=1609546 RepID=UPI002AD30293|nr:hypothetical protein [endosymbiont DhMRE of Dentiscutata heterogama]
MDNQISNWEVFGMRKVGMHEQVACQECGHNEPGIYYDWINQENEETKIICEACHSNEIKQNSN